MGTRKLHVGHWRGSHRGGQGNKAWALIQQAALENGRDSGGLRVQPYGVGPACSPTVEKWGFTTDPLCPPQPHNGGPVCILKGNVKISQIPHKMIKGNPAPCWLRAFKINQMGTWQNSAKRICKKAEGQVM